MLRKKHLLHRALTIWINDDGIQVRIERDDKDRSYRPSIYVIEMLNTLINQPGMSAEVDLSNGTIEYYYLKMIEYDDPDECECKLPEEHCERCTVNGETYQIPY